jgi:hypothetical protein
MAIKTVGVLGCGLMGSGIAQVCAAAGYKTIVREVEQKYLDKGLARIEKFLSDGVAKGKVTAEDKDKTLGNLSGTTSFDDFKDCDLSSRRSSRTSRRRRGLRGARRARRRAHDLLLEHLVALHHRAGGEDEAARIGSPACTSSTPCR